MEVADKALGKDGDAAAEVKGDERKSGVVDAMEVDDGNAAREGHKEVRDDESNKTSGVVPMSEGKESPAAGASGEGASVPESEDSVAAKALEQEGRNGEELGGGDSTVKEGAEGQAAMQNDSPVEGEDEGAEETSGHEGESGAKDRAMEQGDDMADKAKQGDKATNNGDKTTLDKENDKGERTDKEDEPEKQVPSGGKPVGTKNEVDREKEGSKEQCAGESNDVAEEDAPRESKDKPDEAKEKTTTGTGNGSGARTSAAGSKTDRDGADSKADAKADAKAEERAEAKTDEKAGAKAEDKAEAKADAKAEVKDDGESAEKEASEKEAIAEESAEKEAADKAESERKADTDKKAEEEKQAAGYVEKQGEVYARTLRLRRVMNRLRDAAEYELARRMHAMSYSARGRGWAGMGGGAVALVGQPGPVITVPGLRNRGGGADAGGKVGAAGGTGQRPEAGTRKPGDGEKEAEQGNAKLAALPALPLLGQRRLKRRLDISRRLASLARFAGHQQHLGASSQDHDEPGAQQAGKVDVSWVEAKVTKMRRVEEGEWNAWQARVAQEETSNPGEAAGPPLPYGFVPRLAHRALGAYALIRTLSRPFRLTPASSVCFLRALCLRLRTPLLDAVHSELLRRVCCLLKGRGGAWSKGKEAQRELDWRYLDQVSS